jgi:hypothetical protein
MGLHVLGSSVGTVPCTSSACCTLACDAGVHASGAAGSQEHVLLQRSYVTTVHTQNTHNLHLQHLHHQIRSCQESFLPVLLMAPARKSCRLTDTFSASSCTQRLDLCCAEICCCLPLLRKVAYQVLLTCYVMIIVQMRVQTTPL